MQRSRPSALAGGVGCPPCGTFTSCFSHQIPQAAGTLDWLYSCARVVVACRSALAGFRGAGIRQSSPTATFGIALCQYDLSAGYFIQHCTAPSPDVLMQPSTDTALAIRSCPLYAATVAVLHCYAVTLLGMFALGQIHDFDHCNPLRAFNEARCAQTGILGIPPASVGCGAHAMPHRMLTPLSAACNSSKG
jgi:hypothetical protein